VSTLFDELKSDGNGGHLSTASNAKFQGYMIAKLEDISEDIKRGNTIHITCKKDMIDRTDSNKAEVGKVKLYAVLIASTLGTASGTLFGLLKGLF